ncbi:MAG: precorrin-8X methylmutase [Chloroflexus sp.]|uniref:precorrin-8X methylmutase n=1 Tax=Chloroflexus sp. TaxID=1904827 RepID=UPI0021DCD15D|nr:precorrin-8X methylmutase [Chloroflexus sp.]GIV90467.1 MAG: precorrin-8X methylmutase [Chloroflexus sp.]
MTEHVPVTGAEIAARSFAIIRAELAERGITLPQPLATVVERIIHTTADFEFATITQASPGAIEAGVAALQRGCPVITDVQMARVGIDQRRLHRFGGEAYCFNDLPAVEQLAAATGMTRSAAALHWAADQGLIAGAIVAIGNAPTALFALLNLLDRGAQPALIIGVPVGFVNTAESKAALMARQDVAWIVTAGRKGGSPVATAIVNALLRLAAGEDNAQT